MPPSPARTDRGNRDAPHKYEIGQTVTILPRRYETTPPGSFHVVRVLPTEHGVKQYRVRDVASGRERVVSEAELVSGSEP